MLVKLTDMDNDAVLVDPEAINAVTEVYKYDDRGNRVKTDSRFVHLVDDGRIEVKESIGEIYVLINNCDD